MVMTPRDFRVLRNLKNPKPNWITPTLTGATNVGSGYQGARYCKLGRIVYLQGWVQVQNTVATTMFVLPPHMRPDSNLAITVGKYTSGVYSTTAIPVNTAGGVAYAAGLAAGDILYLNSVCFPAGS